MVLRPIVEMVFPNGNRVIAKHKRDEERETRSTRAVGDPEKLKVLEEADAISGEWVTDTRLQHVLDKLGGSPGMERTPDVIAAMIEDVEREGAGEIVASKAARKAIGSATVALFKKYQRRKLESAS